MDHEFFENLYLDTVPGDPSLFTIDPTKLDMSRWVLNNGCFSRIDPLPEPMAQAMRGEQLPIAVKIKGFSNDEEEWSNDLSKSFVVSCYADAQGQLMLQQNLGFGLDMEIVESMRVFFLEQLKNKLKKALSSMSNWYLKAYPDFKDFIRIDIEDLQATSLEPFYPIRIIKEMEKASELLHQLVGVLNGILSDPLEDWNMKWSKKIGGQEYFFFFRWIKFMYEDEFGLEEYEIESEAMELIIDRQPAKDATRYNNQKYQERPKMSVQEYDKTKAELEKELLTRGKNVEHAEYFCFNAFVANQVFEHLSKMREQGLELWIPSNVESLVDHTKPFTQWQKDFFDTNIEEIACTMRKRASVEFANSPVEYKYTSKEFLIPIGQKTVPYTLYSLI